MVEEILKKEFGSFKELAKAMSDGKIDIGYIGKPTYATLKQELFAHKKLWDDVWHNTDNKYHLEDLADWNCGLATIMIKTNAILSSKLRNKLREEVEKMLNPHKA